MNHYRQTGTAMRRVFRVRLEQGRQRYLLGYHPAFFLANQIYRLSESPYIVGSMLRLSGFLAAFVSGAKREVSEEFLNYLRREQTGKMFCIPSLLARKIRTGRVQA